MRLFYLLLISLLFSASSYGQKLVSSEFLFEAVAGLSGGPNGVKQYKINYYTTNLAGEEHIASGLLCVPSISTQIYPLAVYQHGTVGSRSEVPSWKGGNDHRLATAFAANGYVVAAPDYIGLGDSPGLHPYMHAKTEASAALDMMLAVQELAEQSDDVNINEQLFISGYSQGGHAAMALQKEIEQNHSDQFTITASAPMSGPYDVSGKMIEFTLGDEPYSTVSYLAWVILSYKEAYPDALADYTIEDIFMEEYIEEINQFKNEEIDLWTLNALMTNRLLVNGHSDGAGNAIPKFMVKPEIVTAVTTDPTHPLSMALADNNLYNWVPQVPTRMYYCKGDDQVTYENAIVAEQYMNDNGAPDVAAVRKDTDTDLLDHGGCVLPSALDAIAWFGTFQNIMSDTENLLAADAYQIYYANEMLTIEAENFSITKSALLYDMTGKLLGVHSLSSGLSRIDLSSINDGFYVIQIIANNKLEHSSKVIKQ